MKITSITVFQIDLPLIEGQYNWSNDNSVSVFDSTRCKVTPTSRRRWMLLTIIRNGMAT